MNKLILTAAIAATISQTALAINAPVDKGRDHTAFIDRNGFAYATGSCDTGACGTASLEPLQLQPVYTGVSNVKSVAAGYRRTLYLTNDGRVFSTGGYYGNDGTPVEIELPGEAFDIAVEGTTAYILVKTGTYTVDGREFPKGMMYREAFAGPVRQGANSEYIMLAASTNNGAALDMYGNVYTWGRQIKAYGDESTVIRKYPVDTPAITGQNIRYISVGLDHMLGVNSDDEAVAWGTNNYNKLGVTGISESLTPIKVPGATNINHVAAGFGASWFVTNDSKLQTVGWHNLIYQGTGYNRDDSIVTVHAGDARQGAPELLVNFMPGGDGDHDLSWTANGLLGSGGNQVGELGMGDRTERHYFTKMLTPVTTPEPIVVEAPVEEPVVEEVVAEPTVEPVVEEVVAEAPTTTRSKGNASYNNGKGGNYEKTGMVDNGKGKGRFTTTERKATTVFKARKDGRGFKRSNS